MVLTQRAVVKRTRRGLPRQGQQSERPQVGEAGQQPRGEGSGAPASANANATPSNADAARPKVVLRCNYHPGKVVFKVRPFRFGNHDAILTLHSSTRRGHAAASMSRQALARPKRNMTCQS